MVKLQYVKQEMALATMCLNDIWIKCSYGCGHFRQYSHIKKSAFGNGDERRPDSVAASCSGSLPEMAACRLVVSKRCSNGGQRGEPRRANAENISRGFIGPVAFSASTIEMSRIPPVRRSGAAESFVRFSFGGIA